MYYVECIRVVLIMCVVLHSEPAPSAMTALHQFGAEMLRLSRGLEASAGTKPQTKGYKNNWHYTYASKFTAKLFSSSLSA